MHIPTKQRVFNDFYGETMHAAEHGADEAVQKYPTSISKLIMLAVIAGGLYLITSLMHSKAITLPAWAMMLILTSCGILIGGSSTLVPEQRGGRAATYVGFCLAAIGILLMIDVWIFHAAGK